MRTITSKATLAVAVLALVLTASAAAAAGDPLAPGGTFLDDDGNTHEGFIEALAATGITKGCADVLYCPDRPVTRAQLASFVVRAAGIPPSPVDAFVDDDGTTHEDDINALAAAGLTKGCNPPVNDRYCPTDTLTRGQLAAFFVRTFGYVDTDPGDRFVDDDGSIFEAEIEALAAAGITKGCNPPVNDRFCPDDPVLRDQFASFLGRALGLPFMPPPTVATAQLARVYLMLDQPAGGPFLAPVARYLPAAPTPEVAVDLLLAGPNAGELAQSPAFSTSIPAGTTRLGPIAVAGGVATVDLSGTFDDGGGSFGMLARLGQLTYTLAAFDTIDTVMLELDGVPVNVFSSEGIDISGGMDRAYFYETGVVPEILVDRPASWEFVESPVAVTGIARAFEATVDWALFDDDGLELDGGFTTASIGAPFFGDLSITASYSVDRRQVGSVVVWETSARDGSRINLREVPVWLMP